MDVTQYQPVIEKTLSTMRVKHGQKQDMIQECYVALLEHKGELNNDLVASLCRTRARSLLIAQQQLKTPKEDRVRFVSADNPSIAKHLLKIGIVNEGETSESELYSAIESLPDEDRQVIKERFIEGLTQRQTCDKLNLTVEAVKWRQKRGIAALKKYFEVEG